MTFKAFTDFQLGSKKLSDFGAVLWNGSNDAYFVDLLPSMQKYTSQIQFVDGNAYYGGVYEPRTITLSIFVGYNSKVDFNKDEFVNWIKSKEPQWFNFVGDEKKIKVVYDDSLNMNVYNKMHGLTTLKLIAFDPYWYLIDDSKLHIDTVQLNQLYTFTNKGNDESFPLITLRTSSVQQNVIFELNGSQFKIDNISENISIDFESETVYTTITNEKHNKLGEFQRVNGKFRYDFGQLPLGTNNFRVTQGDIASVDILCRSRFI